MTTKPVDGLYTLEDQLQRRLLSTSPTTTTAVGGGGLPRWRLLSPLHLFLFGAFFESSLLLFIVMGKYSQGERAAPRQPLALARTHTHTDLHAPLLCLSADAPLSPTPPSHTHTHTHTHPPYPPPLPRTSHLTSRVAWRALCRRRIHGASALRQRSLFVLLEVKDGDAARRRRRRVELSVVAASGKNKDTWDFEPTGLCSDTRRPAAAAAFGVRVMVRPSPQPLPQAPPPSPSPAPLLGHESQPAATLCLGPPAPSHNKGPLLTTRLCLYVSSPHRVPGRTLPQHSPPGMGENYSMLGASSVGVELAPMIDDGNNGNNGYGNNYGGAHEKSYSYYGDQSLSRGPGVTCSLSSSPPPTSRQLVGHKGVAAAAARGLTRHASQQKTRLGTICGPFAFVCHAHHPARTNETRAGGVCVGLCRFRVFRVPGVE